MVSRGWYRRNGRYQETMINKLANAHCIDDLKTIAKANIPAFVFDYIEEGCNANCAVNNNRRRLDEITLLPNYMQAYQTPNMRTSLLGKTYDLPIGIAPIGLSGLIWPQASLLHAQVAKQANIPFVLSTVATVTIEAAAAAAGENFWFQLYPPADKAICLDLLARLGKVGCQNLVVTVDVPAPSRRIKALKSGLSVPPKITASTVWQSALRPRWSINTLRAGLPEFVNLVPYMDDTVKNMQDVSNFVRTTMRDVVDADYLTWVREHWEGNLIVKGVLNPQDARVVKAIGAQGLVVSNHGGRQLDAAKAPIQQLPKIRAAVGDDMTLLVDGSVASGVDVARYLSQGAQGVLAGRAFAYGVAAGQAAGTQQVVDILQAELSQIMSQLHCSEIAHMPQFADS